MSVIKKITLKNSAGAETQYDIGANAGNVVYDGSDLDTYLQALDTERSDNTQAISDLESNDATQDTNIGNLQTTVGGHTSAIAGLQSDLDDKVDSVGGSLEDTVAGAVTASAGAIGDLSITAVDKANVIWGKINRIRALAGAHFEAAITTENGVHGLRFYDGNLQYWDIADSEWKTISTGSGSDVYLGDVIGAAAVTSGTSATLTWSDPDDVVVSGATLAQWAGTVVVRKAGSAPTSHTDGTVVVNNTVRNQYATTGFVDTGLDYGVTYYYRFFPYKTSGSDRYTAGTAVNVTPARTIIPNVPSPVSSLIYDGDAKSPIWNNYNSTELDISGDTAGTNPGTYTATFTPKTGYCWSDGSTTGVSVNWYIVAASVAIPSVTNTSFTYNGTAQGPTVSSYDHDIIEVTGNVSETNANAAGTTYTLTIGLIHPESYAWTDGTSADKNFTWTIAPKSVACPELSGTYTYNGSVQEVAVSAYSTSEITKGGAYTGRTAGNYTVTFDLTSIVNYVWSDGTTAQKTRTWSIGKGTGGVTLSSNSVTVDASNDATVTLTGATGSISIASGTPNTSVATASLSGTTLTIHGVANGTTSVTLNIAESDNYNAATATVDITSNFLKMVTWSAGTDAEIAAMAEAFYAGSITLSQVQQYWHVGDSREMSLAAMATTGTYNGNTWSVGETHHAQTVDVVILGFEHDTLTTPINGHTKALVSVEMKNCLYMGSNKPTSSSIDGSSNTENGYMESTNTNANGWRGCARRKWCNGAFYQAMPAAMRGAVKPVNKCTSAGNQSSTINTDSDHVWLPSEIEIFGSVTYSKAGEGSIYQYYANAGANRYKYPKWTSSNVSDSWWERSPYGSNSAYFCIVSYNGSANSTNASITIGLAPAWAI
jgi:hypothetical protein